LELVADSLESDSIADLQPAVKKPAGCLRNHAQPWLFGDCWLTSPPITQILRDFPMARNSGR